MAYQPGCQGRVVVGALPEPVQRALLAIPGDWLEYDPPSRSIVVRHVQPTDDPVLPAVTVELVRILSEIPFERLADIEGGDLFNFGSVGVAGNDIVTGALGLRFKQTDSLELGVAWEAPLTERRASTIG